MRLCFETTNCIKCGIEILKNDLFYSCYECRERLKRVGTNNSEAIVRSANIEEIAESSRND